MVDPGEMITETLRREFAEEAMNLLEKSEAEKQNSLGRLNEAFRKGDEVGGRTVMMMMMSMMMMMIMMISMMMMGLTLHIVM